MIRNILATKETQNRNVQEIVKDLSDNNYELLHKETVKIDKLPGGIIRSPVSPSMSKYLYLNSNILSKCIRAISEDIILGKISSDDEKVLEFWKEHQNELFMLCKDYLLYGYAVGELIFAVDEESILKKKTKLVSIKQAPAQSFCIYNIDGCKYAKQELNGNHKVFNIHGEVYPPQDDTETFGTVLWLGGDELYEDFSIPTWYASKAELLSNIVLTDLDIENFQKGNLVSGMLAISGGRQINIPGEKAFDERLLEQFKEVGTGLAVAYIENANPDQKIDMEYINLSNDNYSYLQEKYDSNEQSILEAFFIPKERLLNNESKESMNSNKSNVIWNVYLRSLQNIQNQILYYVNEINKFYLKSNDEISITLPIFEDNTQVAIQNVASLTQLGLMSQSEAIDYLNNNLDIKLSKTNDIFSNVKMPLNNMTNSETNNQDTI